MLQNYNKNPIRPRFSKKIYDTALSHTIVNTNSGNLS